MRERTYIIWGAYKGKDEKPKISEKKVGKMDLAERREMYCELKKRIEKEINKIDEKMKKTGNAEKSTEDLIKTVEKDYNNAKKVLEKQRERTAEKDWAENMKQYYESLADGTEKYKNHIAPYIPFFYDAARLLGCLAGCTSKEAFEELQGSIENCRSWLRASARQKNISFEKWEIPFFPSLEPPKREDKSRLGGKEEGDGKELQEAFDALMESLKRKEKDGKKWCKFEEIKNSRIFLSRTR